MANVHFVSGYKRGDESTKEKIISVIIIKKLEMKTIYRRLIQRTLLSTLIILFYFTGYTAIYYVSNSAGNDSNSGLSTTLAWKTLDKVNATTLKAGDQILFQKGDTFYGSLIVKNSGVSGSPITFGAYGTGENPIITGFTTVTSWTNLGGNIWESTNAVSTLPTCNMVTINGVNTAMGRFPNIDAANGGYLTYQSYSSNVSITSNSLTGTPNWKGAEAVIRKQRFIIERNPITSQSGSTITYTGGGAYSGKNNYGFFIQNDIRTLDTQNEWYFNPMTHKISIYSTSEPTNVMVSSVDTLITAIYKSYLTFENITSEGANLEVFYFGSTSNILMRNINIINSNRGIYSRNWGSSSANFILENSTFNQINDDAINLSSEFTEATVIGNSINNVGLIKGMGTHNCGISINGIKSLIQFNVINNCGFNGIDFDGDSTIVDHNFVNHTCLIKDDGAGIYMGQSTGHTVTNNIVVNTIGNYEGADNTNGTSFASMGIYTDDFTHHTQVLNNSIANSGRSGIYVHNSDYITIQGNTVFNSKYSAIYMVCDDPSAYITNIALDNNTFVGETASQYIYIGSSIRNDLSKFGTFNSNYYARPIDDNKVIKYWIVNSVYDNTLSEWQAYSGQDADSHKSPLSITTVADLQFEYNASQSPKTVSLSRPMLDIKGTKYFNSITLQPYTSAVLIKDPNPVQPITPVYTSSVISDASPTILELTFDQSLANIIPTSSAFTVQVNSIARAINSVSISGSKVILTLSQPIVFGDIVTVAYTKPSTNPLQTESAGQVDSFSAKLVTNDILDLKQAAILTSHFIPVWQGENGINHMNLMVVSATFDDLPLSSDDEIAVFSGLNCVGAVKLTQLINTSNPATYLTISASQNDGSNNGFISNDTIIFKIWVNSSQKEIVAKAVSYKNDLSSWLTTGKYSAGATSVVDLVSYTEYTQTISLLKGYNMISTYVKAADPSVCSVTKPLCDQGTLIKVQDEAGNSYEDWGSFGGWINKLGTLQETEGYKIKVSANCTLQVTGRQIALPLDIPLKTGWNIISFPKTDVVDAMNIIQPLIDQNKLIKVQDEAGNSIEDWGIFGGWKNGIGNFVPGKAYKVKLNADAVLTILENYTKSAIILANTEKTEYFSTVVEGNGTDHMNINVVGLREAGLSVGDELAAFDGSLCVGAVKITENNLVDGSISLVTSFSTNGQIPDGFKEGDAIQLIFWNKNINEESEIKTEILQGQYSYTKNSSVLVKVKTSNTAIESIANQVTIDVFPNPCAGRVTVRFSSFPVSGSTIDILDITGRKAASRVITNTSEEFNLSGQASGLYLVKTVLGSKETIQKLIVKN